MTRRQYVEYLRQQSNALLTIAECIEEHGDVSAYDWLVDIPIMRQFEDDAQVMTFELNKGIEERVESA